MNSEKGEHTLVINDFARFRETFKKGDVYTTPLFTVCGEKWNIHWYLKGRNGTTGDMFLHYLGNKNKLFVKTGLSGEKTFSCYYEADDECKTWGWRNVKGFKNPPGDTYRAQITIEIPRFAMATEDVTEHGSTAPTLREDFAALLSSEKSSDVEFIVEERSFPAHRLILSARSPYFAAMFQNGMKESR